MHRIRYAIAAGVVMFAMAPSAQAQIGKVMTSVPTAQSVPAGMCQIWIDGVPANRQPAPTDCNTARARAPRNSRVIYGSQPTGTATGTYDPRRDSRSGQYDPRYDPRNRQYDPRLDPRSGQYDPRMDSRSGNYDPRFDPRSPKYDPRYSQRAGKWGGQAYPGQRGNGNRDWKAQKEREKQARKLQKQREKEWKQNHKGDHDRDDHGNGHRDRRD